MCMSVSAGAGSSSFSVTLPHSPRLASLRGTSGGPKLCWQSILSRLACQVRYTPLTPASRSPAARLVSPAFCRQCCCRSPLPARQPCHGTWLAVLICSPLSPSEAGELCPPLQRTGLCQRPSPPPRAASRQHLAGPFQCVCKDNKTPTGRELWRSEVPPPA